MQTFSAEAKTVWVNFFNGVESALAFGGVLSGIKDVASKAADNAARLAALFQIAEGGSNAIGVEAVESACAVVSWHLHEARRFFGEIALPAELADAVRLERWLIKRCKLENTTAVLRRDAQTFGPVRKGERLTAALNVLAEHDRVSVGTTDKKKLVWLNPALLWGES
jgi:putative DNA primase/helicase